MKYQVDRSACVSSGYCARVAPGYFELEDDGSHARREDVAAEDEELLAEAEMLCPAAAIRVDEGA